MTATKILWGQIIIVFLIVLGAVWGATQWTAAALAYQPELQPVWFMAGRTPIYPPPAFFWWWFSYDAYAPAIFLRGAAIAASGGILSAGVAIGMSVWRAREVTRAQTYGSARWATEREIAAGGMLGDDGVVLGRFGSHYLRHDGPEHILCFAPTRSGKGVGLVVPSLLTWPGSCIVHDINDERTAKRISDALGTATEMRAMKNYAGHRLSPWLGHLMVSRTETARALLTPGEVMQLPSDQEIVMAAGVAPIRGRKARYYEDIRFAARLVPPPKLSALSPDERPRDDWTGLPPIIPARPGPNPEPPPGKKASVKTASRSGAKGNTCSKAGAKSDPANAGIRREPDLGDHEEIVARPAVPQSEFEFGEGEADADAIRNRRLQDRMAGTARQASLDPDDGVAM